MWLCWHRFGNWMLVTRDELGGQFLARKCVKCLHEQFRFFSDISPHND